MIKTKPTHVTTEPIIGHRRKPVTVYAPCPYAWERSDRLQIPKGTAVWFVCSGSHCTDHSWSLVQGMSEGKIFHAVVNRSEVTGIELISTAQAKPVQLSVQPSEFIEVTMCVRVPVGTRPGQFSERLRSYIDSYQGFSVKEISAK